MARVLAGAKSMAFHRLSALWHGAVALLPVRVLVIRLFDCHARIGGAVWPAALLLDRRARTSQRTSHAVCRAVCGVGCIVRLTAHWSHAAAAWFCGVSFRKWPIVVCSPARSDERHVQAGLPHAAWLRLTLWECARSGSQQRWPAVLRWQALCRERAHSCNVQQATHNKQTPRL